MVKIAVQDAIIAQTKPKDASVDKDLKPVINVSPQSLRDQQQQLRVLATAREEMGC